MDGASTLADLNDLYERALYGGGSKPNLIMTTIEGARAFYHSSGLYRYWVEFALCDIMDGNPRLNPERLPR